MAGKPRGKVASDVSTSPFHDVRNDSLDTQLLVPHLGELLKEHSDYSELKRRLKAEQKAKEKAEKETKAAEAAKEQTKDVEKKTDVEEEINPNVNFDLKVL